MKVWSSSGPLYVGTISYAGNKHPVFSRSSTQESQEPYRSGSGVAIRLTRRFGITIGWWRGTWDGRLGYTPEEIGDWN